METGSPVGPLTLHRVLSEHRVGLTGKVSPHFLGLPVFLGVTHIHATFMHMNVCVRTHVLTCAHTLEGGFPGRGQLGDRTVQPSGGLGKLRAPWGRWFSWKPRGGTVSLSVRGHR